MALADELPVLGSQDVITDDHPDVARSRRRYALAALSAFVLVTIPYLWVLWDQWTGTINPLRQLPPDNFYDLQGRALLAGHLWLPTGAIGIEAFIHAGHQYTYFGLFPSILRLPILAVTHGLDGKLTTISMLLAWTVTGLSVSALGWRTRVLLRGSTPISAGESGCWALFVAAVMGSVLLYLGASPRVSHEDLAWSVALTIATSFALLGVLERPSWSRVGGTGFLVLAAALDRTPTGFACILATGLIAVWFASGRAGSDRRRWALPVVAAALVPLLIAVAVSELKFGRPFGFSLADQVWAQVNRHRRIYIAANGASGLGVHFFPSTLVAYFQPFGVHLQTAFPFVTLPTTPPQAVGGVILDQTLPTASITSSMPMLFLLSVWGVIAAFWRDACRNLPAVRILILTTAAATAGVLFYGYIAERYVADFMPFLATAGAIGLTDLWRLADQASPNWPRRLLVVAAVALGLFGLWANLGAATTPVALWTATQSQNFVSFQKRISPNAQQQLVETGRELPYFAPAGRLFIVGHCQGLYLSTGWSYKTVPGQQAQHETWVPVDQPAGSGRLLAVRFNRPISASDAPVVLISSGSSTLSLVPTGYDRVSLAARPVGTPFGVTWPPASTPSLPVRPHVTYEVVVNADPLLTSITAGWRGVGIQHYWAGHGPAVIADTNSGGGNEGVASVEDLTASTTTSSAICRELLAQSVRGHR